MKAGRSDTHSQTTPVSTGLCQIAWTLAIWAICGTLAANHSFENPGLRSEMGERVVLFFSDSTLPEPFMRAPVAFEMSIADAPTPASSQHSRRPRVKRSFSEIERELQKMFYRPLFRSAPSLHKITIPT